MLSSAGWSSPQLRSRLVLAAVALAALVISLLLAFATAPRPNANGDGAHRTSAETRSGTQAAETTGGAPIADPEVQSPGMSTGGADAERGNDVGSAPGSGPNQPVLRALLVPWAFAVDAIAVLGLAAVLIVRDKARRRRGARR